MSERKDIEQILEVKAQNILKYLKSNIRYDRQAIPRPFMIEITGSISAGKTTIIKELYDFLRPLGFRVWRPQEGAEYIQNIPRDTYIYNVATGLYALDKLVHESFGSKYDIILFDRALYDVWCWMEYWLEKGKISEEDKKAVQSFFNLPTLTSRLDIVYFVICAAEKAYNREMRVALSHRPRETTNLASIENKVNIWSKIYSEHSQLNPNLRLVNTTNMAEQEMVDYVANDILTTLEQKSK